MTQDQELGIEERASGKYLHNQLEIKWLFLGSEADLNDL